MNAIDPTNLTASLVEPDSKSGKFEPDPNDELIQRYVPEPNELKDINSYLAKEIKQAWDDDTPGRNKCVELLRQYRAMPDKADDLPKLQLVKRAVKQNVAVIKRTILGKKPLVTVTPDSNKSIDVLVNDPQFGPMTITKTSEEQAQALEYWLQYKLTKKIPFDEIVEVGAKEAKRGQTPTYFKICRVNETRTVRGPAFGKQGSLSVTFEGKRDFDVADGEQTKWLNVSRYSVLMPADEQDLQKSRWVREFLPESSDDLRASLYNGNDFLIDAGPRRSAWKAFIEQGVETEQPRSEQQQAMMARRYPSTPVGFQPVSEVYFFWNVPMVQTFTVVDGETGEQVEKTRKTIKKLSFVGRWHEKHEKLMSMIRLPYDHGERPLIPIFDDKEPFRFAGESLAEDAAGHQAIITGLKNSEAQAGLVTTTPVIFYKPGSVAGEFLMDAKKVEAGDMIPRQMEDEVECKNLGDRPISMLGLIEHFHRDYENQFQIGSLQLGQSVKSHVSGGALAQTLNQGETQASMFLDSYRVALGKAIKMYVQTEQQYRRFGEVIPFDDETKAILDATLEQSGQPPTSPEDGVAVRFPLKPIHNEFAFNITATSDDRSEQNDFERLMGMKKMVDADSAVTAQMLAPLPQIVAAVATGQLQPEVLEMIQADFKRREFVMELLGKVLRKDGAAFAIDRKLMKSLVDSTLAKEKANIAAAAANPPPPEKPPPPKISISLSGKLLPEQEMAAAQQVGIGGIGGPTQGTGGSGPGGVGAGGGNGPGRLGPVVSGPGHTGGPVPPQAPIS